MPLTVIIPSKTVSNLIPCVQSVRKHEPTARVIVVNDGLQWEEARAEFERDQQCLAGCLIISGISPFVFARNVNLGIRAAG
jgi:glycosyltransferase involved in cell wall biosynthesis